MENKKYTIRYLPTFISQFEFILDYIANNLKNKIAADKLYKEVTKQIEKRSYSPTSFEIFKSTKDKQVNWYKIQVKSFTIFYTVKSSYMLVSRIYYSKRDFDKLI